MRGDRNGPEQSQQQPRRVRIRQEPLIVQLRLGGASPAGALFFVTPTLGTMKRRSACECIMIGGGAGAAGDAELGNLVQCTTCFRGCSCSGKPGAAR